MKDIVKTPAQAMLLLCDIDHIKTQLARVVAQPQQRKLPLSASALENRLKLAMFGENLLQLKENVVKEFQTMQNNALIERYQKKQVF